MSSKIKTKRERVKFASDNVVGACPEVLDAIVKANDGIAAPYGNDEWSTNLQNKLSGPTFIHIKIEKGSIKNLGRPTIHPKEVSRRFQKFLEN